MTLQDATDAVLGGVPVGDVFPRLPADTDRESLRAWFVGTPAVPNLAARAAATPARSKAVPTGNPCPKCGGSNLVRTGTCVTCFDCGENEGCG